MNIVSELIPGARQLRTPLAIGYLWIVVAWINSPRFLKYITKNPQYKKLAADFATYHISLALFLFALSFGAYLIGIFFQALNRLLIITLAFITLLSLLGIIVALITTPNEGFTILILATAVAILVSAFCAMRKHHTNLGNEIAQKLINISIYLAAEAHMVIRQITNAWTRDAAVRDGLTRIVIDKIVQKHPEIKFQFAETLDLLHLRFAYEESHSGFDEIITVGLGQSMNMAKVVARSWVDPKNEELLREYVLSRMLGDRNATVSIIARCIDRSGLNRVVKADVSNAEVLIRSEHRAIFEDSDRLIAEGEFRRGIAIPMAAVIVSTALYYTYNPVGMIAAALPMLLVYFSGVSKERESTKLISSCINAEMVRSGLMHLDDINLLQWSRREVEKDEKLKRDLARLFRLGRQTVERSPRQGRLF